MSREISVMNISRVSLDILYAFKLAIATIVLFLVFGGSAFVLAQAQTGKIRMAVLGDSLTAGYGLEPGEAFPEQLQAKLRKKGLDVEIVNAGVSGDTSTGGLARLEWSLQGEFDLVIVELGANDALRGIPAEITRTNLEKIILLLKKKETKILLAGMLAPPNMGENYGAKFNAIYSDLARKHTLELYPFFLDGVAGNPDLNQADGMHPTNKGIGIIVENILPLVESMIENPSDQVQ